MVNFVILLKCGNLRVLLELPLLKLFCSHFKLNFVKPTLFSFGYDYYWLLLCTSSHGCFPVKSPKYFIAEAPSFTHYWTSPLTLLLKQCPLQNQKGTIAINFVQGLSPSGSQWNIVEQPECPSGSQLMIHVFYRAPKCDVIKNIFFSIFMIFFFIFR